MPSRVALVFLLALTLYGSSSAPGQNVQFPGLGEPGTLQALSIETGRAAKDGSLTLAGRDSGQQLLVTGRYSSGQLRDLTHQVKYEASPADIVSVGAGGYVSALKEGKAVIQAKSAAGLVAAVVVKVTDIVRDVPISFANDVVPIFTRFGCNAGGCHGKSGGQNGFHLSLLGFEPEEDYEYLVKEARGGRRIVPSAPAASLLLQKASGQMPHGGGSRINVDSPFYRMMLRWVEQGTPLGRSDDASITRIEILPQERLMNPGGTQQLAVVAHFSDGSTRDVTRLAQFDSNDGDLASVSDTGLVTIQKLPGEVAIMARFQTAVAVFRATVPLGLPVTNLPPAKSFIDELVQKQWQKLGLPPSPMCDDATFLRRVTIDLAGRLPTLEETKEFLSDQAADKRDKLVDRLLGSRDYADYFACKWSAVLRNKRQSPKDDPKPNSAFHDWIRASLAQNKPFDQFARAILTATGEEVQNPPVTWYREVKDVPSQVEDTAQLFLGTRIQCARCHHHPLEKWSQQDYYGLAAFFAQLSYKTPPQGDPKKKQPKGAPKPLVHIFHKEGIAQALNPRTSQAVKPTVLAGKPLDIPADADPRTKLADWIASKDNPYFARTLVNRYWKHFFGRGLVDPEDDIRLTNPPTNPELLDALGKSFIDNQFDLKKLVRALCTSSAYQLSSEANKFNQGDKQSFARFTRRRLHAEVLFDAIDQVTLAQSEFPGIAKGTRAVQLPDNAFDSYFLTVFGRPDGSSACECERSGDMSLSQVLHLMNSLEVLAKVSGGIPTSKGPAAKPAPKGKTGPALSKITPGLRTAQLLKDSRPHADKIGELYLIAFSRAPTKEETTLLLEHIQRNQKSVRSAYEDILWVLINSEEFLFNH